MCQSIAEGGKRCVAHHPLTNAAASLMAHMYELPENQVKDIYSLLRRQLKNDERKAPASWSDDEIRAALTPRDEDFAIILTPDERLTNKLEGALKAGRETFTEADLLAFKALPARLDHTRTLISRAAAKYSTETGVSLASAREEFWVTYNNVTVPRGSMKEGQVLDARTLEASKVLLKEAVPVEREQTPRITRSAVEGAKLFTEVGYDPDDGRLEVVLKGELYSFHSVPQELAERVRGGSTEALREVLAGRDFRYTSAREAELDGYRARCGGCGQFVAQSGNHGCPRTLEGDPLPEVVRVAREVSQKFEESAAWVSPDMLDGDRTLKSAPDSRDILEELRSVEGVKFDAVPLQVEPGKVDVGENVDWEDVQNKLSRGEGVEFNLSHRSEDGTTQTSTISLIPSKFYKNGAGIIRRVGVSKCDCGTPRCSHLSDSFLGEINGALLLNRAEESLIEDIQRDVPVDDESWNHHFSIPVEQEMSDEAIRYAIARAALGDTDSGTMTLNFETGREEHPYWVRLEITADNDGNLVYEQKTEKEDSSILEELKKKEHFQVVARELEQLEMGKALRARRARDLLDTVDELVDGYELDAASRKEYFEAIHAGRTVEPGYSNNIDQFLRDYKEMKEDNKWAERLTGEVTGGFLSKESGRGFGVELEVDQADPRTIYEAFKEAGIEVTQSEYPSSEYSSWQIVMDSSVEDGCEIVSPILYDSEKTWAEIEAICDILEEQGVDTSDQTGAHVHIGRKADPVTSRGVHIAYATHQDVIRRMASSVGMMGHRGSGYSAPFDEDEASEIYADPSFWDTETNLADDRYRVINQENRNTFEFRDFDGTIHASRIQANVMMAAAVTRVGSSEAFATKKWENERIQPVGSNFKRSALLERVFGSQRSDEFIAADNAPVINTLDALFDTQRERKHMLGQIIAVGWQEDY